MIKPIVLSLVASSALVLSAGCSSSEETTDTLPTSVIAAFNIQAQEEGKTIDAHRRVWYSVRLVNQPAGVNSDHDLSVDVHGPSGVAALRDETDGVPELEDIQYIFENNERLWMSCALNASAARNETWCQPSVPALCLEHNCIYDFRISHEPFTDGIPDGQDWTSNPAGWASGEFRWEDEFVRADLYDATYKAAFQKYDVGGLAVDLTVDGQDVHARGWIRRLKEEQGITVELP